MGRHTCARLRLIGIDVDGGLAGSVAVDPHRIHRVPAGVDADLAVLAEPLAVAVHAVRRAAVGQGEVVVIVGAGPIGLLLAAVARRAGARRILVSEPTETRRAFAATSDSNLTRAIPSAISMAGWRTSSMPPRSRRSPASASPRPTRRRIALVVCTAAKPSGSPGRHQRADHPGQPCSTPPDIDPALALLADDGDTTIAGERGRPAHRGSRVERPHRTGVKVVVSFEATDAGPRKDRAWRRPSRPSPARLRSLPRLVRSQSSMPASAAIDLHIVHDRFPYWPPGPRSRVRPSRRGRRACIPPDGTASCPNRTLACGTCRSPRHRRLAPQALPGWDRRAFSALPCPSTSSTASPTACSISSPR